MNQLRRYMADAGHAFDRAPVEVALAVLAAITLSYGIEHDVGDEVVHIAIAIGIAACAAWSATVMFAMRGVTAQIRRILTISGAILAALYLLLTPDFQLEAEKWRAFMLVGATGLLTFAAPALVRSNDDANLRLRRINGRFFLRAAGIVLYGLALFAGLALALAAVDNLFELRLDGEIYGHVFIWIMVVLVPWVTVGGLDDYVRPLEEQSDIARVVYRLATWLVPVLVAIYLTILYVYAIRIIVTGELPKNLVSPMVLAAGLLTLLTLVVFDPPAEKSGMRWLRYPTLLYLPLAPLGFWALVMRFDDYGWTEFRLLRMVALVAVLILTIIMAMRVVRRASLPLRIVPAVLAVVLLLSAIGPWSVLAVSKRDQQQRLAAVLDRAEVDVRAAPAPGDTTTRGIPAEQYNEIENLATYLHTHFGPDALTEVAPAFNPRLSERVDLPRFYGLRSNYSDSLATQRYARFGSGRPAQMSSGVAYRIEIPHANPQQLRAWEANDSLLITLGTDTLRAALAPAFALTHDLRRSRGVSPPTDLKALEVVDRSGAIRGELILLELNMTLQKGKRAESRVDGILLLKRQ